VDVADDGATWTDFFRSLTHFNAFRCGFCLAMSFQLFICLSRLFVPDTTLTNAFVGITYSYLSDQHTNEHCSCKSSATHLKRRMLLWCSHIIALSLCWDVMLEIKDFRCLKSHEWWLSIFDVFDEISRWNFPTLLTEHSKSFCFNLVELSSGFVFLLRIMRLTTQCMRGYILSQMMRWTDAVASRCNVLKLSAKMALTERGCDTTLFSS